MHKQQGWPQAWEYCHAKPIQTLGIASQGVNWSWIECIKSLHAQMSSGKGLPSHFWNSNNVRSILPGLRRKRVQAQSLRKCCGAFRSSPISALQVEVGEMPISLRKLKLTMNYWIHVKGHSEIHPVKDILKDCWEYGNNKIKSFGWTATRDATILGTKKKTQVVPLL